MSHFAVDDIDAVVASLGARGAELVGEVERYEASPASVVVPGQDRLVNASSTGAQRLATRDGIRRESPSGFFSTVVAVDARRHGPIVAAVRETRRSYDAVAERYAAEISSELNHKPLDRALLDAVAELAGEGPVADIGAGPGHVAEYLAHRGCRPFAVDLSLAMCAVAHGAYALPAVTDDMTAVPLRSASVTGVVCLYAVIHLDGVERGSAYSEFARVLRPNGHLLLAFHVSDHETATGTQRTLREWWDQDVDLVFRFLDPAEEIGALEEVGLEFVARMDREPYAGAEHASRRTYLLFRRPAAPATRNDRASQGSA